jgi:hypothetical protein
MSIDTTWPTSHRVNNIVAGCCSRTYPDIGWLIHARPNDVDELLAPTSLPTGNILIDGLGRERNDSGRMQRMNFRQGFSTIFGVGGEEKPVALEVANRSEYPAQSTCPSSASHNVGPVRLSSSMIHTSSSCLTQQSFMCFLCAVHLAVVEPS